MLPLAPFFGIENGGLTAEGELMGITPAINAMSSQEAMVPTRIVGRRKKRAAFIY
jgi:hypothetical protein